jgi:hypothetical protein
MPHPSPVRRRRQNPPMPPQPSADRADVPLEAASNGHQSGAWPRFEVYIDGRCPIEDTLNVIEGRWKILILWWLQEGELRFNESQGGGHEWALARIASRMCQSLKSSGAGERDKTVAAARAAAVRFSTPQPKYAATDAQRQRYRLPAFQNQFFDRIARGMSS